jgi:hypothetical protein
MVLVAFPTVIVTGVAEAELTSYSSSAALVAVIEQVPGVPEVIVTTPVDELTVQASDEPLE